MPSIPLTSYITGQSKVKQHTVERLEGIVCLLGCQGSPLKCSSEWNDDVTFNKNLNSDDKTNPEENMGANMRPPTSSSTLTSQDGTAEDQSIKKKKRFCDLVSHTENERRAEEAYHIMKNSAKRNDYTALGLYDNQQIVTNRTPISTSEPRAIPSPSTSDISLNSEIKQIRN
uniref:Uncharacterized protein n=1 Tax=Timema cristinae TaxID=61476 RepID=A0A7R9CRA2_TIMCR|nr:unnamed protein product [Timema cristinae]